MAIPVVQRNQIKREILSCIVEDGNESKFCIMKAVREHELTRQDAREIAGEIADEAGEE